MRTINHKMFFVPTWSKFALSDFGMRCDSSILPAIESVTLGGYGSVSYKINWQRLMFICFNQ